MHSKVGAVAVVFAATTSAMACCKDKDVSSAAPSPAACASTEASASAPTKPVQKVEVPAAPVRRLAGGTVNGHDVWLGAFEARRPKGTAGNTWLEARQMCADRNLEMCTEMQFVRACNDDASLGKNESWTVTASGNAGFMVRGGEGGCDARRVAPGSDEQPGRTVLCCQRAVAIRTTNRNESFLKATSGRLEKLEAALNRHDSVRVAAFFDDRLRFYGGYLSKDAAASKIRGSFRAHPKQWAVHDTCDVSLQTTGDPNTDTWTAGCVKLVYRAGEVGVTKTVYVFGGRKTKLQSLTEPRVIRPWSPP